MTWRPPAAFRLLCCSLNSCIFSSLNGTYDSISRVYRSLSNSAICSYRWRLASDIVFHSTPSARAMSGNVISGFESLICDLRALTKHMYAPVGPFGRVGSTISFVLPRPVFFCALAFLPFDPSSSEADLFFVTAPFKKCSTCHGKKCIASVSHRAFHTARSSESAVVAAAAPRIQSILQILQRS